MLLAHNPNAAKEWRWSDAIGGLRALHPTSDGRNSRAMSKFEIVCRSFGNESWTCSSPTHSHGSRCGSVTSINLSRNALCGVTTDTWGGENNMHTYMHMHMDMYMLISEYSCSCSRAAVVSSGCVGAFARRSCAAVSPGEVFFHT